MINRSVGFFLLTIVTITGCREKSLFFPDSISYSYVIDNITIDNPIVIQSDSAVYISSEQLIDSLYGQDLAKSKYAYWMYTIDDTDNALSSLFLKSFRIAVKHRYLVKRGIFADPIDLSYQIVHFLLYV